jgi:rare lipoprotein A
MNKIILLFVFILLTSFDNNISKASYYGKKFHGKKTASGEIFDMNQLTAAHKKLKFGTIVEVISIETKKSVIVRINDRGPFIKGRDIDLSESAFFKIAPKRYGGSIKVKLKIIKK